MAATLNKSEQQAGIPGPVLLGGCLPLPGLVNFTSAREGGFVTSTPEATPVAAPAAESDHSEKKHVGFSGNAAASSAAGQLSRTGGSSRKLSALLGRRGFPSRPITAERRQQLKWIFPTKPARPLRARAAHRTGRVVRSAAAAATSAAGGTPTSGGSPSDDGADGEPDPAPVVRLSPSPAAFALAAAFARLLAELWVSGALAPLSDGSPRPFTATPSSSSAVGQDEVHP